MDTVCPTSVSFAGVNAPALTNGTTLSASKTFSGLPDYTPSTLTTSPTYKIGSQSYTAVIIPILPRVSSLSGRYTLPTTSGEYWPRSRSTVLSSADLKKYYDNFTTSTVTGKTYKLITTTADLKTALTGNVANAKISVSYDLMYSLQYEFCFYARLYSILIKDYVSLQQTAVGTTFTQDIKNDQIRQVVNALNAVNLRLIDLTTITNNVNELQRTAVGEMNTEVNQFMSSIKNASASLEKNATALTSNDVKSKLRTRMVEFSDEKNAYANQLLGLYGFANLIALGLLFYIYRS